MWCENKRYLKLQILTFWKEKWKLNTEQILPEAERVGGKKRLMLALAIFRINLELVLK